MQFVKSRAYHVQKDNENPQVNFQLLKQTYNNIKIDIQRIKMKIETT